MPITDAQFDAFIVDDSRKKVILGELKFAYEAGGTGPFQGTVYVANHRYRTRHDDSPPHRAYRDVLRAMPNMTSRIDPVSLTGLATLDVGDVELDNGDGSLDFMLDLIVDGREFAFYVGGEDWSRADFRRLLVATAINVEAPSEDKLIVRTMDNRSVLDADVKGDELTTGPEAGKHTPLVFGDVFNLTPRLLDAAALKYQVLSNFTATSYVNDVRDNGVSLASGIVFSGTNAAITANAGTDTITRTAHGLVVNDVVTFDTTDTIFAGLTILAPYWIISAGLTADNFRVSLTRGGSAVDITGTTFAGTMDVRRYRYTDYTRSGGHIQLSATPEGLITADVVSAVTFTDVFARAQAIIEAYARSGAVVDAAAFAAADVALMARYDGNRYVSGIAVEERTNLTVLLKRLLDPVSGWVGINRDGQVTGGIVDPFAVQSATVDHEIARTAIDSIALVNQPVRYGHVGVRHYHNLTPQQGLAASVTPTNAALYRQEWPHAWNVDGAAGTTYAGAWWSYHVTAVKTMIDADSGVSFINGYPLPAGYAKTEIAREQIEDNQPHRKLVTISTGWEAWDWDLGDVVKLTHPRYGLDAGINFRLIGIERDYTAGKFTATLINRMAPDHTTADYP